MKILESEEACPDPQSNYKKIKVQSNDYWHFEDAFTDNDIQWIFDTFDDDPKLVSFLRGFINSANELAGWNYDIRSNEPLQLKKYTTNNYYKWHKDGLCDHNSVWPDGNTRKLSIVLHLSDTEDYDGGAFQIFAPCKRPPEILDIPVRKYSVLVFPSHVVHQVTPITRGERYILTAFFTGPPLV